MKASLVSDIGNPDGSERNPVGARIIILKLNRLTTYTF